MVSAPDSGEQSSESSLELSSETDSLSDVSDPLPENLYKSVPKPWVEDLPESEDLLQTPPLISSDKETFPTPHISLVSADAFMRAMRTEEPSVSLSLFITHTTQLVLWLHPHCPIQIPIQAWIWRVYHIFITSFLMSFLRRRLIF